MRTVKLTSMILAGGGLLLVAGCGGGSSSRPTIVVKPDKNQGGSPQVADNGVKKPGKNTKSNGGSGPGDLAGVIKYTGSPGKPGLPSGYVDKDKYCTNNKAKIVDQSLIVGPGGGLKNVVIYLDRKPRTYSSEVPKTPVPFDQKFCTFDPHVLSVRTGQTLELRNNDGTSHNTHITPSNNATYNNTLVAGKTDNYVYQNVERVPVKVKCDIHPWMSAYHVAVDHPFVGITDDKGAFKITGIPSGTYKFNIWHEKAGFLDKGVTITITPGKATPLNRSYAPSKLARYHGPRPKVIVLTQR